MEWRVMIWQRFARHEGSGLVRKNSIALRGREE
jgi:hypothetical protein